MEYTNQIITKVNDKVQKLLLVNYNIKKGIAAACHVDERTVQRWVKKNSVRLTQSDSLRVIREHTGLTDEQILTQDNATA